MTSTDTTSTPSLRDYVDTLGRRRFERPRSRVRRMYRRVVPQAALERIQLVLTRSAMVKSRRDPRLRSTDLRLHLGCGLTPLPGWVNVDMVGSKADLLWDLRKPLPAPDGSAVAIFHEHMLEHLPLPAAVALTSECRRLLAPGGTIRIGVPDFRRYAESYLADGRYLDEVRPGRPTRLLALEELMYDYGHCSMWDGPTLCRLLEEAGFRDARIREFGESSLDPCPDGEHRRPETLYVEASG